MQYKSYAQLQTNYLWSYGTLTGYPSLWSGMQITVIDSLSVITQGKEYVYYTFVL